MRVEERDRPIDKSLPATSRKRPTLAISHVPNDAMGEKFAALIAEKTGGKDKVDMFPNGQLGSEQDTVNNAAMGILDFTVVAINNVTPFSPTVATVTE